MRLLLVLLLLAGCGAELPDASGLSDAGAVADDAAMVEPPDAGEVPGDAGAADGGAKGPVVYPFGALHSPIDSTVAANLEAIAARNPGNKPNVFAKVGDSNTVNVGFLGCFAGGNVDLAGRTALAPALAYYKAGDAAGTTPFDRASLAAKIGWSASAALAGSPSPLEQEHDAILPSAAMVMFGTNDVEAKNPWAFAVNMLDIADWLLARGVVPVFSTIPPRDDSATADALVPRYNAIVRAIAQARQVPLVDLHEALLPLPTHGLGGDGVHLNTYFTSAGARGCVFTAAGLAYGQNTRNLLAAEALTRLRAALGGTPPDAKPMRRPEAGTLADPIVVTLPFVDARDTSKAGEARLKTYSGCSAAQDEGGRELLYALELSATTNLRAMVFSRANVDVDLHLLDATATEQGCLARADKELVRTLAPGKYFISADTYVSGGAPQAGEFLLVLLAE